MNLDLHVVPRVELEVHDAQREAVRRGDVALVAVRVDRREPRRRHADLRPKFAEGVPEI